MDQFRGQPRLPRFACPRKYTVELKPDFSTFLFTGSVSIQLDIVEDTEFLVLNAADLAIESSSVEFTITSDIAKKVHKPVEVTHFEEDEILLLQFCEQLHLGSGDLFLRFEGTLNDKMKGFYRSTYDHEGEKKVMAVTQFEPTDARRCFPCWDEPTFKATFKMILEVPSDLEALSNMPPFEEKQAGPLKIITYEETPIMSTYLVAIVIGLFDYVEDFAPDGTKIRVYCQVGKANLGQFALGVAKKTLDLYGRYFSIPYILPKLDMVAIPDFAFGAMENYGLVTYRETALLYDDQHSAAANKQRVANVVAHELAHQWFGNLVTMEWWTHLWLNEGFATWVSYLSMDDLFPDWEVWTQFLEESNAGLKLDGLAESHPIEVEVNHAREVAEIFDSISYRKGAAVIRMLQNYLGADCFQKALALYIERYKYSNARTEDLWAVLEEESGEPVKRIMYSWTKQKGYPVVNVKMENGKLCLKQSQFLMSGLPGEGLWSIPLTLCSDSYSWKKSFLFQAEAEVYDAQDLLGHVSDNGEEYHWIKVNVKHAGFYRVRYDDELASKLKYAIETGVLLPMDRFGLLDDYSALCMARKLPLSSLLSLMNAYKEESNYTVLSCLIDIGRKVVRLTANAIICSNDIKEFFVDLLTLPAGNLGWESKSGESHLDSMSRGEIFAALADFGHIPTRQEAVRRFHAFLNDRSTTLLPPDLRMAAYTAAMWSMDPNSGYNSLLKIYRETDLSVERTRILSALTSSSDPHIVLEALNFLLSDEVRKQDVFHGLTGLRTEGKDVAWDWLKGNWDYISSNWTGLLLGRFISTITSLFSTEEKAREVEVFFETRENPAISKTLKQSIERIKISAMWIKYLINDIHLNDTLQELLPKRKLPGTI